MPNKTLHLIAFCAVRKLAQQKATGELNVSVRQEVACPNGPNLTKKKKQRFSGRKKGGLLLSAYQLNGLISRARNPRLRFTAVP